MMNIPLLMQHAELARSRPAVTNDHVALEEDLPAVLNRDASGYALAYDSKLTEIDQETTDDN